MGIDDDEPGAPAGYLLDPEDDKSHDHVEEVPDELVDPDGDPLAHGEGEEDDPDEEDEDDGWRSLVSGSGPRIFPAARAPACVWSLSIPPKGARSFRDLGSFFSHSSAQVSSHTGIDDERGSIGEYVRRPDKAWTQSAFNSMAISTELCGAPISSQYPCGARWTAEEWNRHDNMLANLADWIREECKFYGLPIIKLSASQAQGSGHGVCGHVDLGAGGGGHYDPGPNFPWARVMEMARTGTTQKPKPKKPPPLKQTLTSVVHHDGRLQTFEEKPSGEIIRRWQTAKDGGWADHWESLGTPGK